MHACVRGCVCAANSEQKTFFVALSDNKRIQKQLLDCFRKDLDNALAHNAQEQLQIYIIICNVNHYEASAARKQTDWGEGSPFQGGLYVPTRGAFCFIGSQQWDSVCKSYRQTDEPMENENLGYAPQFIQKKTTKKKTEDGG